MKRNAEQKRYCQLLREYRDTDDPQNAIALNEAMTEMENSDPSVLEMATNCSMGELLDFAEEDNPAV